VGYAGGNEENPTYYKLGSHTETIELDYNPTRISYRELLDIFWDSHNPTRRTFSMQYKSAIFYHGEEQKRLALESKAREEERLGARIHTELRPYSKFYLAEDYHQKYYLRNVASLKKEMTDIYPDMTDFVNSTAAARVNGYLGRSGDIETLQREIDSYGLSQTAKERLLEMASS
jgi:methionine-S-sulfoxide reductase